ncbi:zinc ribbon domain-containing protein [Treponema succinifaciens]|uniref:zinc ribbon domain-containing protein n=2 Tax=Treponema TaxID=157 RepID=UPI0023555581|nr:C4-type zinc ribbon domain-containing protein [Treponema succinifaciens]MDY2615182.1 C4-type zinc ribbon domain-containing protein [Treponema succinifaciens]UKI54482.1 MAG: C4-type zinc ribbon domain-containing protein [Treponema succinifaciens]
MQMTEELERLKSLQDVLAEKYEIEAKVEELPKTLDGSTESLDRFKREYIEKNKLYEEKKDIVARLRVELDEAQRKREEGERGMDAISTHREYEILEKQISEAQALEDSKRKELQREEKSMAELNDLLKSEEDLIASTEKDVNEARENLDKEIAACNEKLEALKAQEAEISEGIDSETIMKFQRIIKRNRKGIVAVKGKVCDGCHMILPAQFANEVHHGEKILFCPYCSRILFYEEAADLDENYVSIHDDSSADDMDEDLLEDEDFIDIEGDDSEDSDSSIKSLDYEN